MKKDDQAARRKRPAGSGDRSGATRDRMITAAMELFAERGYRNTTVADIESRAGLAPRSGALYQHFASKEEVLRAGVRKQIEDLERVVSVMDLLPLADFRSELIMLGRWNLQELTNREPLLRLVRQEGDVVPGLVDDVREAVHDRPHREIARWIAQVTASDGLEGVDAESLALIISGSMGYYRMLESIYGQKPLGLDDDRFLDTWVEVCLAISEHFAKKAAESGAEEEKGR
ncbi:TetR/AcrR family transcriptional regulator [Actinoallomurus spadix]|nr:TetR/AcrR family transcriptional regulator [Actinoallomurus spadix]